MKINKLKIGSFGKLKDVSIALSDKITVINAKNEAGKSTIAAFVRYMLYGFYSGAKKELSQNDKKKYTAWDSDSVFGELEFTARDGKSYTAVRKNAARAQSVILDKTGNPAFDKGDAGDIFLGVDAPVYEKSAFVGQGDISFSDDGELEKAINNMVSSGNQDIDASGAADRLTRLKKELLGLRGSTGRIHEIDVELSELIASKQKWQGGHTELLEAESKLAFIREKTAQNNERLERLKAESFNMECLEAKDKLCEIERLKQAALESKSELEKLLNSVRVGEFTPDEQYIELLGAEIRNAEQSKNDCIEAQSKALSAKQEYANAYSDKAQQTLLSKLEASGMTAETALEKASELKANVNKSFKLALILTVLIITAPIAVFVWIKYSITKKELREFVNMLGFDDADSLIASLNTNIAFRGAVGAVKGVFRSASQSFESKKQQYEQHLDTLCMLVSKMGKQTDKETVTAVSKELLQKLISWKNALSEQKRVCNDDYIRFSTLSQSVDINALSRLAQRFDENIPLRSADVVNREIRFCTVQNEEFAQKERELEKRTAVLSETLPKPAEMQSRISSLEEQKKLLTLQYNQLDLAIQAINTAAENTKSNLSPKISKEASEIFSLATDGKYRGLYTDESMGLSFLEEGSAEVRNAQYLSTGTLELAFISLRIALCGYLYKENPTLIFDDAFTHLDDERLKSVTELILKLSEKFQIVIMSCHDREAKLLEGKAKIIDFAVD